MRELSKKFLVTLAVLFIFKLGSLISIPGTISMTSLLTPSDGNLLNILSLVSGASLSSFSIFALGVGPYISSSIIVELLCSAGVPYFKNLAEEGGKGRGKLNRIMRYFSVLIGFIQAFALTTLFETNYGILTNNDAFGYGLTIISMIAGMCVVMWLADLITMHGIGNGASMIILMGIISRLPSTFSYVYNFFTTDSGYGGTVKFALYCITSALIVVLVVMMELAERRVPIQQSNRVVNKTLGDLSYIPLKVNSASVIPVIFASAFMSAPITIANIFKVDTTTIENILSLNNVSGLIIYGLLIVAFTFLYSNMQVDVDKISDNLEKNGSYIPGIRPGLETRNYLKNVLNGITCLGSVFLLFIALLPNVMANLTGLNESVALGGTGIIVAVGVIIECIKNVKTLLKNKSLGSYRGI